MWNVVSVFGIGILLGIAWLCSADRRSVSLRTVVAGLLLQVVFAVFVFVVPLGAKVFSCINTVVLNVLAAASRGAIFLFGRLALPPGTVDLSGESSLGFFLAFQALPTIIFFSALIAVLYYCGIMQFVIRIFARVFTKLMVVSGAESLVVASNVFVGVESALTVKPYLVRMTRSELCTVLTAGMATVASNVLALYVFSLREYFPSIAGHLVSASLLSAPAALVMAKIFFPESEVPETMNVHVVPFYERERSLFEAVINGAQAGVKMIVGIVSLLIAVLGLVALVDGLIGFLGNYINIFFGCNFTWSLTFLLGYLFYPITLILGVPFEDVPVISGIIASRTILTEVVAYQDLARVLEEGLLVHQRSAVIATYALCGFAHVASMSIFVGGIAALAPSRAHDLAKVAPRALLAATFACLLTAAMAGVFCSGNGFLLR